ncbi:hypothetical protein H6B15_07510 [Gemmiger formicilis]|uniref:hypothetical protein n=1 Tax=Gemmiger formicilis TaxID=745368 RepID=UPI00195B9CDA|nr:hypothetical protein [Gemmiger formicilis]MBM6716505.1 hypothetical protein [Gemmiger formicilis]
MASYTNKGYDNGCERANVTASGNKRGNQQLKGFCRHRGSATPEPPEKPGVVAALTQSKAAGKFPATWVVPRKLVSLRPLVGRGLFSFVAKPAWPYTSIAKWEIENNAMDRIE